MIMRGVLLTLLRDLLQGQSILKCYLAAPKKRSQDDSFSISAQAFITKLRMLCA